MLRGLENTVLRSSVIASLEECTSEVDGMAVQECTSEVSGMAVQECISEIVA